MNPISSNSPFVMFLDIDGVVTNKFYHEHEKLSESIEEKSNATSYFDQDSLENLHQIIDALQTVRQVWIVISSYWRIGLEAEQLSKQVFARHKFSKYIVGKTVDSDQLSSLERKEYCNEKSHQEDDTCQCRAAEIQHWLKRHPEVLEYIIFDDIDDHLSHNFKKNYIHINARITKGIKNYIIGNLCAEIFPKKIKNGIKEAQKSRASIALNLPNGMPKIMQFYAYEKEIDSQEVNRAAANAVALIWSYFLEGIAQQPNQRQTLRKAGLLLDDVYDFPSDQEIKIFKETLSDTIFSALKKGESSFLTIDHESFKDALQASGILKNDNNSFIFFPHKANTFAKFDRDGIEISASLANSKTFIFL
jgi:HAD domain in Swiss Army Knife RNA repair proteins